MKHPEVVVEKARRLEQVLLRVEQGEPLKRLCQELGVQVDEKRLGKLQRKYVEGGGGFEALLDGRYGHGVKVNSAMREWLYERKRQDASLTAPRLVEAMRQEFDVGLTDSHVNYLLRKVGLTRAPGRPFKASMSAVEEKSEPIEGVESSQEDDVEGQATENAGLFFPGSGQRSDGDHGNGGGVSGKGMPGL
jgi:transposase